MAGGDGSVVSPSWFRPWFRPWFKPSNQLVPVVLVRMDLVRMNHAKLSDALQSF